MMIEMFDLFRVPVLCFNEIFHSSLKAKDCYAGHSFNYPASRNLPLAIFLRDGRWSISQTTVHAEMWHYRLKLIMERLNWTAVD